MLNETFSTPLQKRTFLILLQLLSAIYIFTSLICHISQVLYSIFRPNCYRERISSWIEHEFRVLNLMQLNLMQLNLMQLNCSKQIMREEKGFLLRIAIMFSQQRSDLMIVLCYYTRHAFSSSTILPSSISDHFLQFQTWDINAMETRKIKSGEKN